jgi:hypothetical protein
MGCFSYTTIVSSSIRSSFSKRRNFLIVFVWLFKYFLFQIPLENFTAHFIRVCSCCYLTVSLEYITQIIIIYLFMCDILGRYQYRVCIASTGRMIDEWWIWKDLEGSDIGIIETVFRNLLGGNQESTEYLSQYCQCLGWWFEPRTTRSLKCYLYSNLARIGISSVTFCPKRHHPLVNNGMQNMQSVIILK